jgi:nicotinamidase-related amidase
MKPALLVVDLQNEFFADAAARPSLDAAVENVNAAMASFRRRGLPVVVILDAEEPGRLPGQDAFEPHPSLALERDDPRVEKRHNNAFWRTPLDELLRARGVDTVVVAGWCAEYCVLSTYRGARERDFAAMLLRQGIASGRDEHRRMVERICEEVTVDALEALLAG